ncbi:MULTISPECIES: PDZ domain-containing protein [unclassified Clostridium]|jgi:membrane protein containing C-terminal PDZ domain|uniref:PDZ domain-containing protein n=1 Tax=unclassified Clostridium TaxID=2614128 RepID=UPI0025BC593B|nr:PDZ domain-containing protein [Clostridium sp.]MCI6693876.1 PDZ domain-containing protein [Clostridium sp.]MDY6226067.1 PDZ domain-containing protein [Clostridium sp.]
MELILYTLRTVAYAIVEPMHIFMLVVLGIMFYTKNKRISIMQKMTIGEMINSPLELTLSQISLGIIAGAIVSVILSMLGIIFNENSGIEVMFMISILLLFIKKRFICFSYSGAVLGAISILSSSLASVTNTSSYINVNILELMTFVGIMHMLEGILVMFDGGRGAIPVFSNRDEKIVGGFAYNRYWALPVAIFIAITSNISTAVTSSVATPDWWPIINKSQALLMLSSSIISAIPLYGVVSYNSVSFTKRKNVKPVYSGVGILIYGIILTLVSQLAQFGIIGQIIVVIFAPLGHEFMIKIQNKIEKSGQYIYFTDDNGVSVLEVAPTSPAYESGIRRGDKILEVNGEKVLSEVEIFKAVRENFNEISFKVKKITGEIVDLSILPKNKKVGMLLVPRMVKVDNAISVDNDDFKKVLDEMKKKN